jgi:hypothetical protein
LDLEDKAIMFNRNVRTRLHIDTASYSGKKSVYENGEKETSSGWQEWLVGGKGRRKRSERQIEENGRVNWRNELLQNRWELSVRTYSYAVHRQANAAKNQHAVPSSKT